MIIDLNENNDYYQKIAINISSFFPPIPIPSFLNDRVIIINFEEVGNNQERKNWGQLYYFSFHQTSELRLGFPLDGAADRVQG
jgi:hypothetical protein